MPTVPNSGPTPPPYPMKSRDALFVGASIALLGALSFMMLGGTSGGAAPAFAAPLAEHPAASESAPAPEMVAAAPAAMEAASERTWSNPGNLTSGIIRGDISLGSSVVDNLKLIYIQIKEAINSDDPNIVPFVQTYKIEIIPELGTPEFVYKNIPFSEFGYMVRAFAEGLNGSQHFVQVTQERPVQDVRLSVTGGVPFSVLLRDQLKYPVVDTMVFMVPTGDPTGRPLLQKKSDNYGSAVFEAVLQGDYDIVAGAMGQPRNTPQRLTVQAHAGARSVTIEVPRGFDLTVYAQTNHGWGIEGAELKLMATDAKMYREYKAVTDYAGKHVFEHLPPGAYQLDVSGDKLQRWTRNITVAAEAPPDPVIAQVIYRR